MAPLSMPLNDPEGHFCCLKPFSLPYLVKHGASRGPSAVAEPLVQFSSGVNRIIKLTEV